MSADIEIKQADLHCPADCDMVVDLIDSYAADPMGQGQRLSAAVRSELAERLRAHPASFQFVALIEGTPVGLAVGFLGFSTFTARKLANLHDFFVRPEYRGRGIGARLLEHVEQAARRWGCCKLTLEVRQDNSPAKSVYCRHGLVAGDPLHEFWTKPLTP